MKSKKTGMPIKPRPVNNIADLSNFMWRGIAPKAEHRCLISATAFAEAEGEEGSKKRTWFRVKDQPIFAWAGMWRDSTEWGPVYSGLMTDCNEAIRPVHDRMPVLAILVQNRSPPLPASPSRRVMPITPANRVGACVDYLPICAAFPVVQPGRHPRFHFRGLLRLSR